MSSGVNIVWDGNSLVAGVGATGGLTLPVQTAALSPVSGSGAVTSNVGVSGQSWADMTSGASDVDAAWVPGKTNILIPWETTNSVFNTGRTGVQAFSDAATYIADRKSRHPWIVLCPTSIPRTSTINQADCDYKNAQLVIADNLMRTGYKSIKIDRLVDLRRAGSPFAFSAYNMSDFSASGAIWYEGPGYQIHLNNAGYALVAGWVAAALRTLPVMGSV
jgi:hypothetical protein